MHPKKSLGQNFLNDKKILQDIVNYGEISKDDIVLEIGPGTGNLTKKLLEKKPKKLIVVEKDNNLSISLRKKFGNEIEIINNDILNCYNEFKFSQPIKVFGNLPYNISTKILISFIKIEKLSKYFKKFIFVFQKEVADRILSKYNSSNYGRLSILTNWKLDIKKIIDIKPNSFSPKPKIDSSLLFFSPKKNFFKIKNPKNLEKITRIFFSQRRKMIKKPFSQIFSNDIKIAKKLKIDLSLRPQNLDNDTYYQLANEYEKLRS